MLILILTFARAAKNRGDYILTTFLQMDDDRCRNAKQTFVFQF